MSLRDSCPSSTPQRRQPDRCVLSIRRVIVLIFIRQLNRLLIIHISNALVAHAMLLQTSVRRHLFVRITQREQIGTREIRSSYPRRMVQLLVSNVIQPSVEKAYVPFLPLHRNRIKSRSRVTSRSLQGSRRPIVCPYHSHPTHIKDDCRPSASGELTTQRLWLPMPNAIDDITSTRTSRQRCEELRTSDALAQDVH